LTVNASPITSYNRRISRFNVSSASHDESEGCSIVQYMYMYSLGLYRVVQKVSHYKMIKNRIKSYQNLWMR